MHDQAMTAEQKAQIDAMSYEELLEQWRFGPVGDPLFVGEAGAYFSQRMHQLRNEPGGQERHVAASKRLALRS